MRIHTDPEAADVADELEAEAFTVGEDVFFREGAYDLDSGEGKKLLAHELTHVIRQRDEGVGAGENSAHLADASASPQ